MGVQIPHRLVSEIPFQNSDKRAWPVITKYGAPIMCMAQDRDP